MATNLNTQDEGPVSLLNACFDKFVDVIKPLTNIALAEDLENERDRLKLWASANSSLLRDRDSQNHRNDTEYIIFGLRNLHEELTLLALPPDARQGGEKSASETLADSEPESEKSLSLDHRFKSLAEDRSDATSPKAHVVQEIITQLYRYTKVVKLHDTPNSGSPPPNSMEGIMARAEAPHGKSSHESSGPTSQQQDPKEAMWLATQAPLFEALRGKIITTLRDHELFEKDSRKRFFPFNTSQNVLQPPLLRNIFDLIAANGLIDDLDKDKFVHRVKGRGLETFIAILLYSRCSPAALRSFISTLVCPEKWPVIGTQKQNLAKLPISEQDAREVLLGDIISAHSFWQNQEYFCAIVLKEGKDVICDESRRLPYVSEKPIGEGAFGEVFAVEIAPYHFLDQRGLSNTRIHKLARKDYILTPALADKSHEREREVLKEIVRNAKKNHYILENLGSLQRGLRYSLFMPLAECDLWDYMMEKNPKPPTTWPQKARIVHCAAELAGAIAYLHDELESENFEKLSCFHMDLKPRNILIVKEPIIENGVKTWVERWKLSDFNMAKVRAKRRTVHHFQSSARSGTFNDVIDFNKLFQGRDRNALDPSVKTINPRGAGTYLAPEACTDNPQVQAESDTWSLGCVLSVVFSYIHDGAAAVTEFGDYRTDKASKDYFFIMSGGSRPRLSDAIVKWFKDLQWRAHKANKIEGAIFKKFLGFLLKKVLLVDPSKRRETRAREIRKVLTEVYEAYNKLELDTNRKGAEPKRKPSFFRKLAPLLSPSKHSFDSLLSETGEGDWRVGLPVTMTACDFSPNADLLVYSSPSTIVAYSLRNLLDTGDVEDLIEHGQDTLENDTWGSLAVSNHYIAVATNQSLFDCFVYYISDPSHTSKLERRARISLNLPQIWRLALSPDAQYFACILRSFDDERGPGTVHILSLKQLLAGGSNRPDVISRRGSISSSSASTHVHWGPDCSSFQLPGPAENVSEFRFSNMNVLYAVYQPEQSADLQEHKVTILAWSKEHVGWKSYKPMQIEDEGNHDILHGLFTSFSPHREVVACTVISQEKEVITQDLVSRKFVQNRVSGHRLLKILMGHDDSKIFCFGTRQAHNELCLFSFDPLVRGQDIRLSKIQRLSGMTYLTEFSASLYRFHEQSEFQVLIASIDGNIRQVKLDQVDRRLSGQS